MPVAASAIAPIRPPGRLCSRAPTADEPAASAVPPATRISGRSRPALAARTSSSTTPIRVTATPATARTLPITPESGSCHSRGSRGCRGGRGGIQAGGGAGSGARGGRAVDGRARSAQVRGAASAGRVEVSGQGGWCGSGRCRLRCGRRCRCGRLGRGGRPGGEVGVEFGEVARHLGHALRDQLEVDGQAGDDGMRIGHENHDARPADRKG